MSFSEKDLEELRRALERILSERIPTVEQLESGITIIYEPYASYVDTIASQVEDSYKYYSEIAGIDFNYALSLISKLADYMKDASSGNLEGCLEAVSILIGEIHEQVENLVDETFKDSEHELAKSIVELSKMLESVGSELPLLISLSEKELDDKARMLNETLGNAISILAPYIGSLERDYGPTFPLTLTIADFIDTARGFTLESLISKVLETRKALRIADIEAMLDLMAKSLPKAGEG